MMRKQLVIFLPLVIGLVVLIFFAARPGSAVAENQGLQGAQAAQAALGTAFTYQGRLVKNNQPVSDTCSISVSLWDQQSNGAFLNSNTLSSVQVRDGLFTIALDFGSGVFNGQERWLETAVKCTGDSNYITLSPRTMLTPTPYALYSLNNWALNGNSGTGGSGFLGTTDDTAITIGTNGQANLRIYPQSQSPNIVGGYSGNTISPTTYGQTIAGGGSFFYENRVLNTYGTVGGGRANHADGYGSTIAGGIDSQATNDYATVAGGLHNYATGNSSAIGGGFYNVASGYVAYIGGGDLNIASTQNATIGGGYSNTVTGGQLIANNTIGGGVFNYNSGFAATIAGGHGNQATGEWSSMGGGGFNTASNRSSTVSGGEYGVASGARATIGGGAYNVAAGAGSTIGGGGWNGSSSGGNQAYGPASTIGGGYGNYMSPDAGYGVIGGGQQNQITATAGTNLNIATVGGGYNNRVMLGGGTIGGGNSNTASGFDATVGGGNSNTASGAAATVPGGNSNLAQGNYSLAAGYRAKSLVDGTFCWGDTTNADLNCSAPNSFVARASGGASFYTSGNLATGVTVAAGSGSWSSVSDRNVKTNLSAVNPREILAQVAQLPISTWNYTSQDASIRHIGPMAQDFYASFSVGEDDRHISTVDADGVSLAAIQGLYEIVQEKDAQIATQQEQIDELEQQNAAIEARLTRLEQAVQAGESSSQAAPFNPLSLLTVLGLGAVAIMWMRQRSR